MPASATKSRQCASRLSPIENRGNCCASSTSTSQPRRWSKDETIEPDGPAPTTTISRCSGLRVALLFLVTRFASPQRLLPQQHGQPYPHFREQPQVQADDVHVVE